MDSRPVFYDPKGRRGTFVTRVGAFLASLAAVLTTATLLITFFTSLYLPGVLEPSKPTALPGMPSKDQKLPSFFTSSDRQKIVQDVARDIKKRRSTPLVKTDTVAAGFYAPWEASGLASLRQNAPRLTHVLPQWLHLTQDGKDFDAATDFDPNQNPGNRDVIGIARKNGLSIIPILDNFAMGFPDKVRMQRLLDSPEAQEGLATALTNWLTSWQFQGINLDFELVGGKQNTEFVQFLKVLRSHFDTYHLTLTVDIEAEATMSLSDVSDLCDWVVLMAYDEHSEDGSQGPIASIGWSDSLVEKVLETVPNNKLVLGLGNYAYDWVDGKAGADNQTFQEAISNAAGYRSEAPSEVIHYDTSNGNNSFAYRDDDDQRHVVWLLDGISAYNQWKSARENDIRGAALWYLGAEDPSTWTFFDRRFLNGPMNLDGLKTVHFPYEISFTGRGEILTVRDFPKDGNRTLELEPPRKDGDVQLISKCVYDSYAYPYVIEKRGYIAKKLALTFDDGPDPQWTPQILDVLKQYKAPATFFVIGNSCESHPGLVAQEYAEGHEIGSHSYFHPNMGAISEGRDRLELNLTQLAIEMATGRSTTLFRPPYNADSEPETVEQLTPILISAKMGYVTVAENVDPMDWDLKQPLPDGGYRRKTADDIVQKVDSDLKLRARNQDEGNMVLLHDAGGDRSATVAALKKLIPLLRSEGYEFVSVSTLMHTTRDKVMPPVQDKDKLVFWLGKIVLGSTYGILWFLSIAFVAAIGLGLLRISIVTVLALVFRKGEKVLAVPGFQPSVSVLIAAYNEEAVIRRTIESVLHSDYPIAEVLVIDDGSSDGTSHAVKEGFGEDPRVVLVRQENGGKASALNNGVALAQGEILFCIDADTQLDPVAIKLLIGHFTDEKVGAVAGNVRVGNEVNVITYWQSLEYTTSQNLDRRAYALLNAITVVPGAIGAWRKSAIQEVGGYVSDTLAEDMDLTWRLRRKGYRLANEAQAYAYTEAPQTFKAFFGQRFRWAYGTLQCLYKHRGALFHYGWFGGLALPSLWVFQVCFQAIAPLVDVEVIISLVKYLLALAGSSSENGALALGNETQTILQVGFLYALFFVVELIAAVIATRLERQRFSLLWWLFLQRFAYRQIMYGVIYRSLVRAITGGRAGWGKLDRKGTVRIPKAR